MKGKCKHVIHVSMKGKDCFHSKKNPILITRIEYSSMWFPHHTHLSLDMLQSITVLLLVLTIRKGSCIVEFKAGGPWFCCSFCWFLCTKLLNAICCRKKKKKRKMITECHSNVNVDTSMIWDFIALSLAKHLDLQYLSGISPKTGWPQPQLSVLVNKLSFVLARNRKECILHPFKGGTAHMLPLQSLELWETCTRLSTTPMRTEHLHAFRTGA